MVLGDGIAHHEHGCVQCRGWNPLDLLWTIAARLANWTHAQRLDISTVSYIHVRIIVSYFQYNWAEQVDLVVPGYRQTFPYRADRRRKSGAMGIISFLGSYENFVSNHISITEAYLKVTDEHRNPISLASIISICSLLTAPFVQQVIQVKYMTLAINSTLTPDRVLYHNQVGGYFTNYVGPIDVPGVLISSMDQGISFNRDLNDPLSRNFLQLIPSCPTGNCSFDVHDSLAVCSECADLSSLLEVQQNYTPPNSIVFYNYTSTDEHNNTILKSANWTTEYASNRMNWTLPNGFSHSIWVNLDPVSEYTTRMYYETSEY
jgi:hypothetical protein